MRNVLIFLLLLPATLLAQREPVLKQIDLPHPYYYREMYLPQLTSGPSWVTWSPDSKEVIYSMAGSLWRQKIDSGEAVQLTDGPGYDYQPDWSRDGKYVVYTKYDHDALELWVLDLASGKTWQLTKGGAVNVEPRWSPDGKRIAYVSTAGTKHFHIFLMDMDGNSPTSIRQLTKENISTLPRYYYSKYDHEISPAWSPDGKDIVFISNHGHIHGTGGIWRATVPESGMIDTTTNAKEIHYEETNWKARPEFSPDGKRIVYASYLGRQWHQLWLMPAQGGDVFPLTYNDYFDLTNPRSSSNGEFIAAINNHPALTGEWWDSGDSTSIQPRLSILRWSDGLAWRNLANQNKRWLRKHGTLRFVSGNPTGQQVRISIEREDGTSVVGPLSQTRSDDSLFPGKKYPRSYFNADLTKAPLSLAVLPGKYSAWVTRGIDFTPLHTMINVAVNDSPIIRVALTPIPFSSAANRWVSGDLHVHENYGGTYVASEFDADHENIGVVEELVVNKEQRFPSIDQYLYNGALRTGTQTSDFATSVIGQEFHTSYWGHLGLLNTNHLIIPGYAGYPNTAAASLVPMDADIADMAHAQNKDALVGWVHPFDELPDPYKDAKLTNELPIDVALDKIDYYEVLGFSDHKSSAAIWYRLLNLGFHLPAGAGTDAMTNFASLRGPVGLNRVYVNVSPGPLKIDEWLRNLKAGQTFATNGPLLRFTLGGQLIGGEVKLEKAGGVPFTAALRSIVPVDKVEVVCDGAVVKTLFPADQRSAATQTKDSQGHAATTSLDVSGTVPITKSGWCVLRAYSDHAEEPIMDIYPYGTTSPIYLTVSGEKPRSPEDAKFFSKWIERVREDASVHPDYNTPQEREHVLKVLDDAAKVYAGLER